MDDYEYQCFILVFALLYIAGYIKLFTTVL